MIRHLLANHWQTNYHNATYQGNPRHQEKKNRAQISESFARNYGQLPSCKADKQLPCTTGAISWSLEYACWCMSGRIGGATCCQSNPTVVLCGISFYWVVLDGIVCIEWYWMVNLPSSQSHRHLLQSSSSPHLGHHQDVQVLKDFFSQKSLSIRIFSFNRGLLAVALILVAIKAEDPDLSTNESLSFIHFDPFNPFEPLSKDAPTRQISLEIFLCRLTDPLLFPAIGDVGFSFLEKSSGSRCMHLVTFSDMQR